MNWWPSTPPRGIDLVDRELGAVDGGDAGRAIGARRSGDQADQVGIVSGLGERRSPGAEAATAASGAQK